MMTTTKDLKAESNGDAIWRTMIRLRESRQSITRKVLQELTGLPYTIVDDHTSRWIDSGRLRRVLDGVYEFPEPGVEPRPISVTILSDGSHLIECGDQTMLVSSEEFDTIGRLGQGGSMRYVTLQHQHQMSALLTEATVRNRDLSDRISDVERENRRLAEQLARQTPQLDLLA